MSAKNMDNHNRWRNRTVAYAELILNGDPETYLKTVTEYKSLDS